MTAEGFNPDLHHLRQIEAFCADADQVIEARLALDPTLLSFAQERSEALTETIARGSLAHQMTEPVERQLSDGFTKLAFAFTDAQDYADTPSDDDLLGVVDGFMRRAMQAGVVFTLPDIARYLDGFACRTFFVNRQLDNWGELDGLNASQRLAVVSAWLEIAAEPETDEPQQ